MNILMPGNGIAHKSTLSVTHTGILAFSTVSMMYLFQSFHMFMSFLLNCISYKQHMGGSSAFCPFGHLPFTQSILTI